MKPLNSAVSTAVIFAAASATLFVYLLGMRFYAYPPGTLFLISIGLMIAAVAYQCFALSLNRRLVITILVEITVANLLFHLIYQLPGYGLWGSDPYSDFASMKGILTSGFVRGVPDYVQITSYFPILHVLGAQITLVTGIDPLAVAKWSPSVIDLATVPLLYLLVKYLFRQDRAALLATLLLATLQNRVLFTSLFVRETVAVVLAICCVYLYFTAKSSPHPVAYRILSMFMLAGTIFAHHLTAVMLVLFLAIHFIVSNISRFGFIRQHYLGDGIAGEHIRVSFPLLAAAATVTYWVTTIIVPLEVLARFMTDLLTPSSWGRGTYVELTGIGVMLPTARYYVLIYGSYLCYLLFGLLLLGRTLPRVGSRRLEMYSSTLYLIVCGALGLVSFFLVTRTVVGDRFITFGWLFAFGPLVVAIFEYKRKWLVTGAAVLTIIFMAINMYTIHPTEWNPYASGSGATASRQDFALSKTINFTQGRLLGTLNNLMANYYTRNTVGQDVFQVTRNISVGDYDWIIVNRKGLDEEGLFSKPALQAVSELHNLDQDGSATFDCIYESDNLAVFQKTGAPVP